MIPSLSKQAGHWKLVIRDKAGVISQLRDKASGQVNR